MTSVELATELEVTSRTILRDIDALTEAGLPVIAYQGNQGGFELGFNYRTRLTGLALDEAEALALILNYPTPAITGLGMGDAAARARSKLMESLPDPVRNAVVVSGNRFRFSAPPLLPLDSSLTALAGAVREARFVRVCLIDGREVDLHPSALVYGTEGWFILDVRKGIEPLALADLDHLQIGSPGTANI